MTKQHALTELLTLNADKPAVSVSTDDCSFNSPQTCNYRELQDVETCDCFNAVVILREETGPNM